MLTQFPHQYAKDLLPQRYQHLVTMHDVMDAMHLYDQNKDEDEDNAEQRLQRLRP